MIEKFFEIKVNHVAVTLGHAALGLGYRLMSGASGSEAVAVLGKRRVPALLENLQQGLLDQSVVRRCTCPSNYTAVQTALGIG